MDLDLRQEATDLYGYIASRASAYTPDGDQGPGGMGPVMMVYAGYCFDQSGWFALIFDRRANAGHDGEWTRYCEGNTLDRPTWVGAGGRNEVMSIQVCGDDGQVWQSPRGGFSQLLGRMLIGVLQRAERDGVFARIPRADGFRLGLEEFNGSFGWDSQPGSGGQSDEQQAGSSL